MLKQYLEYLRSLLEQVQGANPNSFGELLETYKLTATLMFNVLGLLVGTGVVVVVLLFGCRRAAFEIMFRKAKDGWTIDDLYKSKTRMLIAEFVLTGLITPFVIPTVLFVLPNGVGAWASGVIIFVLVVTYLVYMYITTNKVGSSIRDYILMVELCKESARMLVNGNTSEEIVNTMNERFAQICLPVSAKIVEELILSHVSNHDKVDTDVLNDVLERIDWDKYAKFRDGEYIDGTTASMLKSAYANKRLKDYMM